MKSLGNQKGIISIVLALLTPALLVALALVVDAGYLMLQKARLQNYANAAALSGAKSRLILADRNCDVAKSDAQKVIGEASFNTFSCNDSEVYAELKITYQPVLLGFVGFSSGDLIATARAGKKLLDEDSGQIVLLGEVTSL